MVRNDDAVRPILEFKRSEKLDRDALVSGEICDSQCLFVGGHIGSAAVVGEQILNLEAERRDDRIDHTSSEALQENPAVVTNADGQAVLTVIVRWTPGAPPIAGLTSVIEQRQ